MDDCYVNMTSESCWQGGECVHWQFDRIPFEDSMVQLTLRHTNQRHSDLIFLITYHSESIDSATIEKPETNIPKNPACNVLTCGSLHLTRFPTRFLFLAAYLYSWVCAWIFQYSSVCALAAATTPEAIPTMNTCSPSQLTWVGRLF